MKSPLVSVLITAYNRKNYIADAVQSVLDSSFTDVEIIISDDCSTDGTYEKVKEFEHSKNVRIYRNAKNLGQFENRNFAASLATGKYIKYLDSDDTLYQHGLQVMVDMIEKFPDAVAAISHDKLHEDAPYPVLLTPREAYRAFFINGGFPNSGPSAAIINREIFIKSGGFSKPYYVGTDSALWVRLASTNPIVKIPPALNWYRRHEGQAINDIVGYLEGDYPCFNSILNSENCPLSIEEIKLAKHNLTKRFLRDVISLGIKKGKPGLMVKLLKKSGIPISDMGHIF
jgi:glycosyltransferase involved in cell wall biosynthesis